VVNRIGHKPVLEGCPETFGHYGHGEDMYVKGEELLFGW
jgi:hypothetical protein